MTMPSSGEITMQQINVELRRSSCVAQIGLDDAENGAYGAINQFSARRPNPSNPASLDEWYGYDHRAVGVYEQRLGYDSRSFDRACENIITGRAVRRTTDTQEFPEARRLYQDLAGTTYATAGWYADEFSGQVRYWAGSSFTNGRICRI